MTETLLEPAPGVEDAMRRARRHAAKMLRERLKPPPNLTVSEWSDLHRYLPATAAEKGRWRTSRTPYLREIMDCFSDPLVERVVFMKAAQIGGSEFLLNVVGYFIDQDPAPILIVQASDGEAAKFSKERVAPLIQESPVLAAKVRPPRSRDGGNTIEAKEFPGGHLGIVGANTPVKLRSRPRRIVLFDEVDGYPASAGHEGDPIDLGEKRTSTYWNRKIGAVSTPTVKGGSRIERAYEQSDQRIYLVPCPHCGHEQRLLWGDQGAAYGLKWEPGNPETAQYLCENCAALISERHKLRMLERGRWEPRAESAIRGYHLSALYSPWYSWADIVREFFASKDDPQRFRVWTNTRLGETFVERGDAPPWQRIYDRREDYPLGTCPEGVMFLTIGADVQKDRIEAYVWGWGQQKESWLIDHVVVEGDPYDLKAWAPVTELLHRSYPAAAGRDLPIAAFAIDTGFAQDQVAAWARRTGDRRVMLVKGDHWKNWTTILGAPTKSEVTYRGKRFGLLLWTVGGALVKQETYGFLRLPTPLDGDPYPPGWVHIPMVSDEVVKQLVAEDLITEVHKRTKFTTREWRKNRHRNEALDCRVYARAAAEQIGLSRLRPPESSTPPPKAPPPPEPRGDEGGGGRAPRAGRSRRGKSQSMRQRGWLK